MTTKMAIKSVDQLPVVNQFSVLRPVMADQKLRTSIRLLCVFAYNGQEVIVATDDDRVYGFGANLFGRLGLGVDDQQIIEPQLNTTLTGKAVQTIGFGYGFCVAVTAAGRCYSWGDNKYGQLGVGTKVQSNTPLLIDALADQHVVDVACGSDHSLLLTAEGRVYAMGRNHLGQLGNRSYGPSLAPTLVPMKHKICLLSCGKLHSLALTESGRVLVWGSNDFGQLGRSREVDIRGSHSVPFTNTPEAVLSLDGLTFKKALCGPNNTLLLSTDGRIFAFGENIYGQIGNGSRNPQFTPHHVSKGLRFKDIVAYYDYRMAIAVSADDKYYVWGHPIDGGFACIPKAVPESTTTHTVYDIYAKYSKLIITIKTIVFESDSMKIKNGSIAMKTTEKLSIQSNEQKVETLIDFGNSGVNGLKTSPPKNTSKNSTNDQLNGCSSDAIVSSTMDDIAIESTDPMTEFAIHLSKAFDNKSNSDFVFRFNDKTIDCHKSILKIRNKEFAKDFIPDVTPIDREIPIGGYSYESFYAFLQFLYAMKPEINSKIAREVSKLATFYGESVLRELCEEVLKESVVEAVGLANVCNLYEKSITSGSVELEKSCVQFAKNNFKAIIKLDSFDELPKELAKRLMISAIE